MFNLEPILLAQILRIVEFKLAFPLPSNRKVISLTTWNYQIYIK